MLKRSVPSLWFGICVSVQLLGCPGPAPAASESVASAATCPSLTSVQGVDVPINGLRAAQLKPGAPASLVLYGSEGVFTTRLLADGTLAPPVRVSAVAHEAWPLDVDGDGRDDLVLGFPHDSLGVALTSGKGEPGPVTSWVVGRWLAAGDLDGDHRPEIAVLDPSGEVQIAWNDHHGGFGRVTDTHLSLTNANGYVGALAIGDLTAEHAPDLVAIAPASFPDPDTVRVYRASASGAIAKVAETTIHGAPAQARRGYFRREAVIADVDGRKGNELMVLRVVSDAPGQLQALRIDGSGQLVADPLEYNMYGEEPNSLTAADLNDDGSRDVMCGATSDGLSGMVQIRWNDGSGGLSTTCEPYQLYRWNNLNVAAADLNGDGAVDIAQALLVNDAPRIYAVALTLGEPHQGRAVGRSRTADVVQLTGAIREVFPNPARGVLMVRLEPGNATTRTVELFDLAGRRVVSKAVDSRATETVLDTQHLRVGTYLLAVRDGGRVSTGTVTVAR